MRGPATVAERLRRPRTLAAGVGYLLAAAVAIAGAARPLTWLVVAGLVATYLLDSRLQTKEKVLDSTLRRVAVGLSVRFVLRELVVVAYLFRAGVSDGAVMLAVATLWLMHALRAAAGALALKIRSLRTLPLVTRNLDLAEIGIPDAPSRRVMRWLGRKLLHCDLPLVAGACLAGATGRPALLLAGAGLSLAALLGITGYLAVQWHRNRHLADRPAVLTAVEAQVRKHAPEVVLYFSGSRASVYQVNMWLRTVESLRRPGLVLLRERSIAPLLDRTTLPVLCLPSAVTLMNFDLSEARVGLFVSNVGKNIHLLRVPGLKTVFIGHGDSDKVASFNPYSKVYDEVWVAGPAGRERYDRAQVGVRDEDIVEVGRPQLADVQPAQQRPPGWVPTVLYAPTWEGWTDDVPQTSLLSMGPELVARLLAHDPPLRVLYKPHPLTGTRLKEAKQVHQEIRDLLQQDNAARAESGTWPVRDPAVREATQAMLADLAATIRRAAWLRPDPTGDEAQHSRDRGQLAPEVLVDAEEGERLYEEAYWAAEEPWRHRIVTGRRPSLYSCFDAVDLLIADISSVVSDFLASEKPYVVTNVADEPPEEFREANSAAMAAYLLDTRCEIEATVDLALGPDPMRSLRRTATAHLLGADPHDSPRRFAAAVDALALRARPGAPLEAVQEVFEPESEDPESGQTVPAPVGGPEEPDLETLDAEESVEGDWRSE